MRIADTVPPSDLFKPEFLCLTDLTQLCAEVQTDIHQACAGCGQLQFFAEVGLFGIQTLHPDKEILIEGSLERCNGQKRLGLVAGDIAPDRAASIAVIRGYNAVQIAVVDGVIILVVVGNLLLDVLGSIS